MNVPLFLRSCFTLDKRRTHAVQVFYLALVLGGYAYALYVVHVRVPPTVPVPRRRLALLTALLACALASFAAACTADPGYISAATAAHYARSFPRDTVLYATPQTCPACGDAFVRPPRADDSYAADFGEYLRELTDGRPLTATVEYTADGVPCVSLAADTVHVNTAVVRQGLATVAVPRAAAAAAPAAALAALREAQEKARAERLNLWRYGDIDDDDDDDEDNGKRSGAGAAGARRRR